MRAMGLAFAGMVLFSTVGCDRIAEEVIDQITDPSRPSEPTPPGEEPSPIAHWDFNENQGIIVADVSGNGHHGEIVGTAEWVVSGETSGLRFSNDTEYVRIPDHPDFELNSDYTFIVRVKLEKTVSYGQGFWCRTKGYASGLVDNKFSLKGNALETYYEDRNDRDEIFNTPLDFDLVDTWYTFTFARKGDVQYQFVNDQLVGSRTTSVSRYDIDSCSVNIGHWFNANDPQGGVHGIIDYIKLYDQYVVEDISDK